MSILLVWECVQIKYSSNKYYERYKNHNASYNLIYYYNARVLKFVSYLVYKPCQAKPPQKGSCNNAEVAYSHLKRASRFDECELCKHCHEDEDDKRIRERQQKPCHAIMYQCSLLSSAAVHILSWVRAEWVDAEQQKHYTSKNLKEKLILAVADQVHNKTHSQASKQGIDDIACSSTDARYKTLPTTFIQCSLYTEYAYRSDRSWGQDAY